jgi:hypothetical protein
MHVCQAGEMGKVGWPKTNFRVFRMNEAKAKMP